MNKIYNPLLKLLFLTGIVVCSRQSIAQVAPRDSMALVGLYNGAGGTAWIHHTNWLSANVPFWYGVTAVNGRVTAINLPGNNMNGPVTDSLVHLDSLVKIDFSGNALTSFPALTGLHLDSLLLQNNAFTFKDLVPNRSLATTFVYAPQDSVDVYLSTTVVEQSSYVIRALVDNAPPVGDNYAWYLDTNLLVSSTANSYSITCMDSAQAGAYGCAITNLLLPALTLDRRLTIVNITGLANPGTSFSVCDTNSTLMGVPPPVGGTILWSVVSGSAVITYVDSPVTAVTNLSVGPNVFNYAVSAGNISCPSGSFSNAQVVITRDTNPSLTYAGADFSVCGSQATLHADTPAVGTGTWTVLNFGNATVLQPNSAISQVNDLADGVNRFKWQIVNGACAPAYFSEVHIFRDDTLTHVSAGSDTSVCPTQSLLTAQLPAGAHGMWSVVSGSGTLAADSFGQAFENDTTFQTQVTGLSEYQNTFQWTVYNTCNSISANVNVTVYQFLIADAGMDTQVYFSPINAYILADSLPTASGGNGQYSYMWSPAANLNNDSIAHPAFLTPDSGTFTYTVTVTDGHGCTASASVSYQVVIANFLTVPTLFTPNGDGVNDVLYIPGIESYPNNELIVADRNDQVVYDKKGYKNDWGGINELGYSRVGELLSPDTYFYTLKLEDGRGLQTGFFLIKY